MAGRPAAVRSLHSAPAAPVVSLRSRSPLCRSDPWRCPHDRGSFQESGLPGEQSREFRYLSRAQAIPRPHLDVVFAGCGAELF
ncbi:hypothetical protein NDU88_008135 [Pleurodeles waltl]|uniref:Uncharacterized protein n=1 Tax=Pleurodeles waltl TaxID=8319 RepID=A0AAV7PVS3_PLEWA|nr:hypothetical protein NDU88_008135 [Pleurodeles waltl]